MINEIMEEMGTALGVTFIPETGNGTEPSFPYGTYELIKTDFEQPHQRCSFRKEAENGMVEIQNYYNIERTVRLTFYNQGETGDLLDQIMELASNALFWLQEEGRSLLRSYELVVVLKKSEIKSIEDDDEDIANEDKKHTVTFDFILKEIKLHSTQIESITSVDYKEILKK